MNDSENHVDTDDLDAFENEFFEREPEKADDQEEVQDKEEVTETELETDADEDASDDEDEDQEDREPEEEPKPKGRKSAQERINEITAEKYELLRRLEAAEKELQAKSQREEKKEEPKALRDQLPADAPSPDAMDEDGKTPLYPLGEFDPKYIRDLTRFTIAEETKAAKEAEAKEKAEKEVQSVRSELQDKWTKDLEEAEKEIPEIRENISRLGEAFKDVDSSYGEYLAMTIMSTNAGPQIMNYLSDNIGEAQKIVASGPAAATLAIGRLEARLLKPVDETQKQLKKVTEAPTPAEQRTRGRNGQFAVQPDTDDLDAFEKVFFKKR